MVAEAIEIEIVNQELILVFESAVPGGPSGTVYRGGIAGNLSDQADLWAALQAKANEADLSDVAFSGLYSDLIGLPNLSTYQLRSEKGQPLGYAELDINGLILTSQLPSYVDDVLEYNTIGDLPVTGQSGKIYVILTGAEANKTYRRSGSIYVEISPSLVLGETASTAYRGDRGKIAYDHSQTSGNPHNATTDDIPEGTTLYHTAARVLATVLAGLSTASTTIVNGTHTILQAMGFLQGQVTANKSTMDSHIADTNNPHNVTKTQVGLGNVDNTSDVNKPVSTLQAAADASILASAQAYADANVVGLRDDRGNYTPSGSYPSSGGSGPSGQIKKGDTYLISGLGLNNTAAMGAVTVADNDTVRALADTPGQTDANRSVQEGNIGYAAENKALKDQSNGYAGLTLLKINFKNVLGTFTSFFTNSNTATRTYTFPDRDGTVADDTDLATKVTKNAPITPATKTKIQFDANGLIIAATDATTADINDSTNRRYLTDAQQTALATHVVGPASATDSKFALYDGTTGKLIKNGVVGSDGSGNMTGVFSMNGVAAMDANIFLVNTVFRMNEINDTVSGSNATMSFPNGSIRRLNNAALVSIDMMPASYAGAVFMIVNCTGNNIDINNDTGATAGNRFLTGTGANYTLKNNASIFVHYNTLKSRWMLIGL